VVALALLLPMIGRGFDEWLAGGGRRLALALAVSTLLLCVVFSNPQRWLVAGVPALLLLGGALPSANIAVRKAAVVAGITASVIAAWPLLGLQPSDGLTEPSSPWPEAVSSGRVYSPTPTVDDMSWFTSGLASRRAWPIGYLNLLDGLELVRTDSPVANGALMDHLRITDEGPHRRWWLDALAAEWVILPERAGVPEAMESVRVVRGMRLLQNRQAWPKLQVVSDPPEENVEPGVAGRVVSLELAGNRCLATVEADAEAWIVISMAPVRGWSWTVDGLFVEPLVGPGVLQSLPIEPGHHFIEGVYRPPGLVTFASVSAISTLLALGLLAGAAWSRFRAPPDTLE
jgi:hypothetical protein